MQTGHLYAVKSERPFSCSATCWAFTASSRCFESAFARGVESSYSLRSMNSVEESSSDCVCVLDVDAAESELLRRGRFAGRESCSERD